MEGVTQTSPLFVKMIFEGRYTKLSLPYFPVEQNNINTHFEVFVFSAHEEHGYSRKSLQEYYRKKVQRILL